MADRYNLQSQLEHLQQRHVGTGNADTSKMEWALNQQRDSLYSYMAHPSMLDMFAVIEGQSRGRVRYEMIHRMIRPFQTQTSAATAILIATEPKNGAHNNIQKIDDQPM